MTEPFFNRARIFANNSLTVKTAVILRPLAIIGVALAGISFGHRYIVDCGILPTGDHRMLLCSVLRLYRLCYSWHLSWTLVYCLLHLLPTGSSYLGGPSTFNPSILLVLGLIEDCSILPTCACYFGWSFAFTWFTIIRIQVSGSRILFAWYLPTGACTFARSFAIIGYALLGISSGIQYICLRIQHTAGLRILPTRASYFALSSAIIGFAMIAGILVYPVCHYRYLSGVSILLNVAYCQSGVR